MPGRKVSRPKLKKVRLSRTGEKRTKRAKQIRLRRVIKKGKPKRAVKRVKPAKKLLKKRVLPQLKQIRLRRIAIKPPKLKAKIKSQELQKLRKELLAERDRLVQELESLGSQSLAAEAKGGHNGVPGYSIHMAEYASDSQAMDTALGIRTLEEERLVQIEEALKRIEEGNYGICEACGKVINMERLLAIPSAQFCIECKKAVEMGKV